MQERFGKSSGSFCSSHGESSQEDGMNFNLTMDLAGCLAFLCQLGRRTCTGTSQQLASQLAVTMPNDAACNYSKPHRSIIMM